MELTDEAGDKICIFGFSRGAHTAQGLAAMLSAVRCSLSSDTNIVGIN